MSRASHLLCGLCGRPVDDPAQAQLFIFDEDIRRALDGEKERPWRAAHDQCLLDYGEVPEHDTWYWMPLDELMTEDGLRKWDEHLAEKKWTRNTGWWRWRTHLRAVERSA